MGIHPLFRLYNVGLSLTAVVLPRPVLDLIDIFLARSTQGVNSPWSSLNHQDLGRFEALSHSAFDSFDFLTISLPSGNTICLRKVTFLLLQ